MWNSLEFGFCPLSIWQRTDVVRHLLQMSHDICGSHWCSGPHSKKYSALCFLLNVNSDLDSSLLYVCGFLSVFGLCCMWCNNLVLLFHLLNANCNSKTMVSPKDFFIICCNNSETLGAIHTSEPWWEDLVAKAKAMAHLFFGLEKPCNNLDAFFHFLTC